MGRSYYEYIIINESSTTYRAHPSSHDQRGTRTRISSVVYLAAVGAAAHEPPSPPSAALTKLLSYAARTYTGNVSLCTSDASVAQVTVSAIIHTLCADVGGKGMDNHPRKRDENY